MSHNITDGYHLKSYDNIAASIRYLLRADHPDIHVQHHDTYTVLFKLRDNDNVDSIPTGCFCLHILRVPVHFIKINRIFVESTLGDHRDTTTIIT